MYEKKRLKYKEDLSPESFQAIVELVKVIEIRLGYTIGRDIGFVLDIKDLLTGRKDLKDFILSPNRITDIEMDQKRDDFKSTYQAMELCRYIEILSDYIKDFLGVEKLCEKVHLALNDIEPQKYHTYKHLFDLIKYDKSWLFS